MALTAFVVYNSVCRPILPQSGLRGGRGVRATLNANSVKKQRINAKNEPSKCSGLAISRRRQIYAMIGVELRPQRLEKDIFVRTHLHTARIVVRMYMIKKVIRTFLIGFPHWAILSSSHSLTVFLVSLLIQAWSSHLFHVAWCTHAIIGLCSPEEWKEDERKCIY